LCDEPTGALDSASSREILILLERINRTYGTTILLVTHNAVIRQMANKVLTIRDGRIVDEAVNASPVPAAELEDL
ncbi:MAG: ABC transporter ATP-binding protein, partial [Clostridia bacterium]|nr:ABC transporter ATP-binding protein [Clostridia bacterium]